MPVPVDQMSYSNIPNAFPTINYVLAMFKIGMSLGTVFLLDLPRLPRLHRRVWNQYQLTAFPLFSW